MIEREELLWLLTKLRAHAASARAIGSEAEADSFDAKVAGLMAERGITEEELGSFQPPDEEVLAAPAAEKLHCYRVLYAAIVTTKDGNHTQEKARHVIATSEQAAGDAVVKLAPVGVTHQVQQVAAVAKDVVLA